MNIFLFSFVFGIIQILLLRFLIWSVTKKNGYLVLALFLIKFTLYGLGIARFMFRYLEYVSYVAFGYIIGMILTAFSLFIYTAFFSKENKE
ncbi:MAG TPA: hypothetical protein DEW35_01510 [Ruminococcaceae bacterium]|nr:hypothetical protein [Oscillospiraceae bacterium]